MKMGRINKRKIQLKNVCQKLNFDKHEFIIEEVAQNKLRHTQKEMSNSNNSSVLVNKLL
jgi:hypothetical protein